MNFAQILSDKLHIPTDCFRELRPSHFACLVQESWLHRLVNSRYVAPAEHSYQDLVEHDPRHLVARSTTRLPAGWTRVAIQVLQKTGGHVTSLVEHPLCGSNFLMSPADTMQRVMTGMHQYMWLEAREKYRQALWPVQEEQHKLHQKKQSEITRDLLKKLYRCPVISASSSLGQSPHKPHSMDRGTQCTNPHPGLCNPYAVIEFETFFFIVFPFEQYSLWDCVTFSPDKLQDNNVHQLFVFYQILHSIRHCHRSCLAVGNVQLEDFGIDERCWTTLSPSNLSSQLCKENMLVQLNSQSNSMQGTDCSPCEIDDGSSLSGPVALDIPPSISPVNHLCSVPSGESLPSLVQQWMLGHLSNFDYLMALNYLAGRRMYDPNHHPIVPWVMDLKNKEGSFRDLTKKKKVPTATLR